MSEVIDLLNRVTEAKGPEFTEGLIAGINLATPKKKDGEEDEEKEGI